MRVIVTVGCALPRVGWLHASPEMIADDATTRKSRSPIPIGDEALWNTGGGLLDEGWPDDLVVHRRARVSAFNPSSHGALHRNMRASARSATGQLPPSRQG